MGMKKGFRRGKDRKINRSKPETMSVSGMIIIKNERAKHHKRFAVRIRAGSLDEARKIISELISKTLSFYRNSMEIDSIKFGTFYLSGKNKTVPLHIFYRRAKNHKILTVE